MPAGADIVEVRVLDGPNLYFPRPAVKLTLSITGWLRASEATVGKAQRALGVNGDPGIRGSEQRVRTVGRIGAALTRRLAAATGVTLLAVRARPGPAGSVVVVFPWRHRGAAVALARGVGIALDEALRRSPVGVVSRIAPEVAAADPGPVPTVSDPAVPVIQVTGTNGKTTTVRLLAHLVSSSGRRVAYSSTDGVYRDGRRVREGDYSGFGGAASALAADPDIAVLETARGGILQRGIGVLHNDVAVVTNVSADHLGLHGIDTVDQLAEVKSTILRITRPDGWAVLNADDPRVLAMRRAATGRPWLFSLDPHHPALRDVLAEGGRATSVLDGRIVWFEGSGIHRVIAIEDVPSTLAGISSVYASNALAAASAAFAVGLTGSAIVRGLRTFVLDRDRNPGRANLFALDGRTIVIDYAHNEAGMRGLIEVMRGLRPAGAETWLAICTAGDRTDAILRGFAFEAAVGADHLAIADLRHYTRGRTAAEIFGRLGAAAAEAGVVDPPRYRGELHALREMVAASRRGDVVAVTALGMRPQLFRWLASTGARPLTPADVRRRARAARG